LEAAASCGAKHPGTDQTDEIISIWEIRHRSEELVKKLNASAVDRDTLPDELAAIIWHCARLAGMNKINLAKALITKLEKGKQCQ
jgi:NTP pyrophosphatase (non-canonical NTP hydrolase)